MKGFIYLSLVHHTISSERQAVLFITLPEHLLQRFDGLCRLTSFLLGLGSTLVFWSEGMLSPGEWTACFLYLDSILAFSDKAGPIAPLLLSFEDFLCEVLIEFTQCLLFLFFVCPALLSVDGQQVYARHAPQEVAFRPDLLHIGVNIIPDCQRHVVVKTCVSSLELAARADEGVRAHILERHLLDSSPRLPMSAAEIVLVPDHVALLEPSACEVVKLHGY